MDLRSQQTNCISFKQSKKPKRLHLLYDGSPMNAAIRTSCPGVAKVEQKRAEVYRETKEACEEKRCTFGNEDLSGKTNIVIIPQSAKLRIILPCGRHRSTEAPSPSPPSARLAVSVCLLPEPRTPPLPSLPPGLYLNQPLIRTPTRRWRRRRRCGPGSPRARRLHPRVPARPDRVCPRRNLRSDLKRDPRSGLVSCSFRPSHCRVHVPNFP